MILLKTLSQSEWEISTTWNEQVQPTCSRSRSRSMVPVLGTDSVAAEAR
jgi:hypothetical protein